MQKEIGNIIRSGNILSHKNRGVTACIVQNKAEGSRLACEILLACLDPRSALYLSGGSTPDTLYGMLSSSESLQPGAVGLVDERYGIRLHARSNELMIKETGLLRYLGLRDIPFYPILEDKPIQETADDYDDRVRSLSSVFRRSVAVLGVGEDGHIAGIAPNRMDFNDPVFSEKSRLVSWFDDSKGPFKTRVTMTHLGLSMMDFLLVMAFGDKKKQAVEMMFTDGLREDIPARFLTMPDISPKTLFITDQKV